MRSAVAAGLAGLMLAACAPAAAPLPQPPPSLAQTAEYGFGDAVASADERAIGHTISALAPDWRPVRIDRYVASPAALTGLRTYYRTAATRAGWTPLADPVSPPRAQAIAFTRSGQVFAVAWATPRPGAATTPVNVISFRG